MKRNEQEEGEPERYTLVKEAAAATVEKYNYLYGVA